MSAELDTTLDAAALARLGRALARVITPRAVQACLGVSAVVAVPRARAVPSSPMPPAAAPIWLWCAGRAVEVAVLTRALGAEVVAAAGAAGLCAQDGDAVVPTVRLAPLGVGLVLCDLAEHAADDRVPWIDDSTLHLLGALPPRPPRWLDVGTGPAALPLAIGAGATTIHATDLNPRAIALATRGLALAGRADVTVATAALLDGAPAGWDLITMNAPMPASLTAATSTWHRGPDELLAALWPAARARLAPGGEVLVHGADDGDRFAPPAALGGAVTIARYTPGDGPGFAITRWRPDASAVHRRGVIVLDAAHPFVRRADLDAIAGDGPHVGVDLR